MSMSFAFVYLYESHTQRITKFYFTSCALNAYKTVKCHNRVPATRLNAMFGCQLDRSNEPHYLLALILSTFLR